MPGQPGIRTSSAFQMIAPTAWRGWPGLAARRWTICWRYAAGRWRSPADPENCPRIGAAIIDLARDHLSEAKLRTDRVHHIKSRRSHPMRVGRVERLRKSSAQTSAPTTARRPQSEYALPPVYGPAREICQTPEAGGIDGATDISSNVATAPQSQGSLSLGSNPPWPVSGTSPNLSRLSQSCAIFRPRPPRELDS